MKRGLYVPLILAFSVSVTIAGAAREKDKGNYVPCQKVFVTGNQPYSVQWADENLFTHTCLAPQADPSQATAILDLEPSPGTSGVPNYTPKENTSSYWIGCHRAIVGVTCEDSEGHQTTTTCTAFRGLVSCSTYEGPDPVTKLLKSLLDLLTRNAAYAYLYDAKTHELLWKYQGSWPWDKELMFASACPKKRRAGTWGTSGGVPNGMSCDEQKLPTDLLQATEPPQPSVDGPISSSPTNTPTPSAALGSSIKGDGGSVYAYIHAESDPSGADIEVDGSFVGNTPSDIRVIEGEHTIVVKKKGFKGWERKLKVSGGSSVRIKAELEWVANQ